MKKNTMFFDDKVRLEVNNYEGALAALELAEDMTEREFENVLHRKDAKHKRKTSAAQEKMKRDCRQSRSRYVACALATDCISWFVLPLPVVLYII